MEQQIITGYIFLIAMGQVKKNCAGPVNPLFRSRAKIHTKKGARSYDRVMTIAYEILMTGF